MEYKKKTVTIRVSHDQKIVEQSAQNKNLFYIDILYLNIIRSMDF